MAGPDLIQGAQLADSALATNGAIDISSFGNPRTFAEAEQFVDGLLGLNQYNNLNTATGNSTRRPGGIRAIISQVDNVVQELERSGKLAPFLLSQAALHVLNPAVSAPYGTQRQIFNPISLIVGPPPFFGGLTTDSISPVISYQNPVTDLNVDNLKQLYEGNVVDVIPEGGIPPVRIDGPKHRLPSDDGAVGPGDFGLNPAGGITFDQKIKDLNLMDKGSSGQQPKDTFETQTIFEAAGPANSVNLTTNPNASQRAQFVGDEVLRPDLAALFKERATGPNFGAGGRGYGYSFTSKEILQPLSQLSRRQRSAQKNIDSFMNGANREFEQNNGYLEGTITDTEAVVPFYFQDLRQPDRFLYFRAFISNLSETITPEWNTERFYGRVDPVGVYKNTTRSFSVGFLIVAMSQEGLTTMWRKINNFCKLLYPTYTSQGLLSRAPVVRLRIGDVVAQQSTNAGTVPGFGLPGFIENVEIDYTDAPWEIVAYDGPSDNELGIVPHWARISFTFTVIHEKNPSIDENYNFNSEIFRRMGSLRADNSATQESRDQQNQSTPEIRDVQQVEGSPQDSDEGISIG